MKLIAKRSLKLFAVFVAFVMATVAMTYLSQQAGAGEQNLAGWVLIWLMAPAFIFQMATGIGETYVSSFGVVAIVGTLVFYFLVCLVLAWLWTKLKAR